MRKLEKIARKLCEVDGNDPDALAYPPMQHQYAYKKQYVLMVPRLDCLQPRPLWNLYLPQAEAAVRAMEGMYVTMQWDARLRDILSESEDDDIPF